MTLAMGAAPHLLWRLHCVFHGACLHHNWRGATPTPPACACACAHSQELVCRGCFCMQGLHAEAPMPHLLSAPWLRPQQSVAKMRRGITCSCCEIGTVWPPVLLLRPGVLGGVPTPIKGAPGAGPALRPGHVQGSAPHPRPCKGLPPTPLHARVRPPPPPCMRAHAPRPGCDRLCAGRTCACWCIAIWRDTQCLPGRACRSPRAARPPARRRSSSRLMRAWSCTWRPRLRR